MRSDVGRQRSVLRRLKALGLALGDEVYNPAHVPHAVGDPQADLKTAKAVLAARIIAVLNVRGLAVHRAPSSPGSRRPTFRTRSADLGRSTPNRVMRGLAVFGDQRRWSCLDRPWLSPRVQADPPGDPCAPLADLAVSGYEPSDETAPVLLSGPFAPRWRLEDTAVLFV